MGHILGISRAKERLTVISDTPFETSRIRSVSLQQFLLEGESRFHFDSDRAPWAMEG
jgi:hypothetical protein